MSAPFSNDADASGSVYIFNGIHQLGLPSEFSQEIKMSTKRDRFGFSLSVEMQSLAIGSPGRLQSRKEKENPFLEHGSIAIFETRKSISILLESFVIPDDQMNLYKNGAREFYGELCLKVDFDSIDSVNITILMESDFIKNIPRYHRRTKT